MERYRITTTDADGLEQTWVLLPDRPSAFMQAEEHARKEKKTRVRVYHEQSGQERALVLDLNARA
ncbi:MAG: hypothetical protein ACO1SX_14475 [Actinomycetota bacterium]